MADRNAMLPESGMPCGRDGSSGQDMRSLPILPYTGSERQCMGKRIAHSPILGSIVGKSRSFESAQKHRWGTLTEDQAKVSSSVAL